MSKNLIYKILLHEEPEGGFTVTVPSLPGCVTYGKDLHEAVDMAKEAIEGYVESLKEKGDNIPDDTNTFESAITIAS